MGETRTIHLLARVIAGDENAVTEFVILITPIVQHRVGQVLVRQGAYRYLDIRQEVLDLTQDVFRVLFEDKRRSLRAWNPARGMSVEGYVGMIAERRAKSKLRSKADQLCSQPPDELEQHSSGVDNRDPERIASSKEILREVIRRVRGLLEQRGERALEMFELLIVQDRSVPEICRTTGMSANAVHQWRHRLEVLIKEIEGQLLAGSS